jgi:hypothetical protein
MTNKPGNHGTKPKRRPKSQRLHTRRLKQAARRIGETAH